MSGASKLPRNWYICTRDERHVVRASQAGMIFSDAINDPTLYDHNTAKKVADELMGMLSMSGIPVMLLIKPIQPGEKNDSTSQ